MRPHPGEANVGFDAYLRYTFAAAGTYYLGVSNSNNVAYSPATGDGDTAGGSDSIGAYVLIVQEVQTGAASLSLSINPGKISELGGVALASLSRVNGDASQALTVTLVSSDTSDATVPNTVTIPANVLTVQFQVIGVHNTTHGTTLVGINATAPNYKETTASVLVTDRDQKWHNFTSPMDVDADGNISPLDILEIINYVNVFGSGDVPIGTAPPYYDVDGDNQISPLDVLVVINYLNEKGSGEGEQSDLTLGNNALSPNSVDAAYAQYAQAVWPDTETNLKKSNCSSK